MGGFEEFCGGPVWDPDVTWNTNDPDFTDCFHKTVLSWTPCLVFLLFVPFELRRYCLSPNRRVPFTLLNVTKLVLTGVLAINCVAGMIVLLPDAVESVELLWCYQTRRVTVVFQFSCRSLAS